MNLFKGKDLHRHIKIRLNLTLIIHERNQSRHNINRIQVIKAPNLSKNIKQGNNSRKQ